MTKTYHPIRDLPIHVYHCKDAPEGFQFLARFGNGRAFPIVFSAAKFPDAHGRAAAFREETLQKHEKRLIDRKVALERARANRRKKEG